MKTEALIDQLVADARPVRRLLPPIWRAVLWLTFALLVVAGAVALNGSRLGLADLSARPRLAVELAATLLTGITAAIASFHAALPDRSRLWLLLPLPPLAVWLSCLGLGCWMDWLRLGPQGLVVTESFHCIEQIVTIGALPGALMILLLRRAQPLAPLPVAVCGALAVAALSSAGLSLFHRYDTSIMTLVWHVAATLLLTGTAGSLARPMLAPRRSAMAVMPS